MLNHRPNTETRQGNPAALFCILPADLFVFIRSNLIRTDKDPPFHGEVPHGAGENAPDGLRDFTEDPLNADAQLPEFFRGGDNECGLFRLHRHAL